MGRKVAEKAARIATLVIDRLHRHVRRTAVASRGNRSRKFRNVVMMDLGEITLQRKGENQQPCAQELCDITPNSCFARCFHVHPKRLPLRHS
jgi:hypothetical protein